MGALMNFLFGPPVDVHKQEIQQAAVTQILKEIEAGDLRGFVVGEVPIALAKDEVAIVALPRIALWEPRSIRIRNGKSGGSSVRIMKGFSVRMGTFGSASESHDEMRNIDTGTLVVTNRRFAFVGNQRTISVNIKTLIGVDAYSDGIGVHYEKRDKTQSFAIPTGIVMTDDHGVSFQITGQILHNVVTSIIQRSSQPNTATKLIN